MDRIQDLTLFGVPFAFVWTALLIEMTPGPNMSYLAVLSAAEGRRAGFAAVAGIATGLLIVGVTAAFGLAAIISQSPLLYELLRWCGVLYLVWLAYDIWRGDEDEPVHEGQRQNGWLPYFERGLISNLLNPKAAVFYVVILPPFLDPTHAVLPQTVLLSVVYVAVATVVHLFIVTAASTARTWLRESITMTSLRHALAISVLVIAIWLAWSTRSSHGA